MAPDSVEIRVTPSHVYIFAYGNYQIGATTFVAGQRTYGIATADRTGAVPRDIIVEWSDAEISSFAFEDSTVDPEEPVLCFNPVALGCPYLHAKDASRDHEHLNSTSPVVVRNGFVQSSVSGDLDMSDLTAINGDAVPAAFLPAENGFNAEGSAYWGSASNGPSTGQLDDAPGVIDRRFADSPCGAGFGTLTQWFDVTETEDEFNYFNSLFNGLNGAPSVSTSCGKFLELRWPDPTIEEPYPKPYFWARVFARYSTQYACVQAGFPPIVVDWEDFESNGEAEIELAANDLKNGFTLTANGVGEWTWRFSEDGPDMNDPFIICNPDPSRADRTIELGIEWSFSP